MTTINVVPDDPGTIAGRYAARTLARRIATALGAAPGEITVGPAPAPAGRVVHRVATAADVAAAHEQARAHH